MASVLVPVVYIAIVIGSLLIFSRIYRKRAAGRRLDPYFPSHPERDLYVTLLGKSDPPAHESLLKAALVRRAMTDVQRVMRLREDKPALQNLLQKGSIGDDLWNSLLAAEKELEAEVVEVVSEANTFVEGWGQIIFQTANEMLANEKMRAVFEDTDTCRQRKEEQYGKVGAKVDIPKLQPVIMPGPPPPGAPGAPGAPGQGIQIPPTLLNPSKGAPAPKPSDTPSLPPTSPTKAT